MIAACKCGNCGHIEMSKEDDVTLEIDFVEMRILYICRQCKHTNIMDFDKKGKDKKSMPLPGIRVM